MAALETYGWTRFFADAFAAHAADGLVPGRVAREHQHIYCMCTESGELLARVAGRLRHQAAQIATRRKWRAIHKAARNFIPRE